MLNIEQIKAIKQRLIKHAQHASVDPLEKRLMHFLITDFSIVIQFLENKHRKTDERIEEMLAVSKLYNK